METVNVSDLKKLIATAHATLCVVIHALDTKVLVGEINRPSDSVVKIKRKRRTKKEIALTATAGHIEMDLEKEYQAERHASLPDADRGNTFYEKKKKKEKKNAEES